MASPVFILRPTSYSLNDGTVPIQVDAFPIPAQSMNGNATWEELVTIRNLVDSDLMCITGIVVGGPGPVNDIKLSVAANIQGTHVDRFVGSLGDFAKCNQRLVFASNSLVNLGAATAIPNGGTYQIDLNMAGIVELKIYHKGSGGNGSSTQWEISF